jgi:hypothetical protein
VKWSSSVIIFHSIHKKFTHPCSLSLKWMKLIQQCPHFTHKTFFFLNWRRLIEWWSLWNLLELAKAMFFFWWNFVIFQQRNWENFGNLYLFSANLTTFNNFIVKLLQNFDTKRMRGGKKTIVESWNSSI